MARVKPAGKLADIADAALTAFGRGGFRLTQMADAESRATVTDLAAAMALT